MGRNYPEKLVDREQLSLKLALIITDEIGI